MSERLEVIGESIGSEVEMTGVTATTVHPWALRGMRQRLTSSSLLRHNVLLFVANMASSLFAYMYHPVVGRLLGPEGYGTVISIGALGTVLLIPSQVITGTANKFAADLIAQGRLDQVNYLFRRLTRYAILAGLITTVLYALFSPSISHLLKSPQQYIILSSLGFLLAYSGSINVGVIQGRQQFGWFATLGFLGSALRVVFTALILFIGFGITGTLIASLAIAIFLYAIGFIPIRDVLRVPQTPVSLKPLFVYSLGSMLAYGGGTYLAQVDTVLAKTFLSGREAGYYAAIVTMGRIVLFIGGSLVWVMFPKVAAHQQQGRSHTGLLLWTLGGVFLLSASVELLFWLVPGPILSLIFHNAPPAIYAHLFAYGLAMLFLGLANVLIYYFLSLGDMKFVPILLGCCLLQTVFISIWHKNIGQLVVAMDVVMGILLFGIVVLYCVQVVRRSREARRIHAAAL